MAEAPLTRRNITFAQAEGKVALPSQLALGSLSKGFRAAAWASVYNSLAASRVASVSAWVISGPWLAINQDWEVIHNQRMADDVSPLFNTVTKRYREIFETGSYIVALTFIEFLIRSRYCPEGLKIDLIRLFPDHHLAYRVIDASVVPIASEAEGLALEKALVSLKASGAAGARQHLLNAGSALSRGEWATSVRESIHAVESLARKLEPAANTLGPALKQLEARGHIHPALRKGFDALYGYTSDQGGIRHALTDSPTANVDEADALYMYGACAAFVTYLSLKAPGSS